MSCLFCSFVKKERECFKVLEDDDFFAFLDINPINPGHTLLIPKIHVSDALDMEDDLYSELFLTARNLSTKIKNIIGAPRIGLVIEGFGVNHVHIHLVPVYQGNELNPERARPANREDLQIMQGRILTYLSDHPDI